MLFSDDCSSFSNWSTDQWGIEAGPGSPSGPYLSDSPFGPYEAQSTNTLTLAAPVDLGNAVAARLNFLARWDIEGRFDGLHVLASSDGAEWMPLCGRSARPGFEAQGTGLPVYDAQMPHWVEEEIDLADYCGGPLWLRWAMSSNAARQFDGFHLDEVRVRAVQLNSASAGPDAANGFGLWPNPANDAVQVHLPASFNAGSARLEITDAQGRLVQARAIASGAASFTWHLPPFAPGPYLVRLVSAHGPLGSTRLMVAR